MGVTSSDLALINRALELNPNAKSICELGSQNLYTHPSKKPPFASTLYASLGLLDYTCIDLAGDNNALKFDLSYPIKSSRHYDIVTDFGTSEHVVRMNGYRVEAFHEGHINSVYPSSVSEKRDKRTGYYHCWCNKHNLLKVGGIMINVNPETGSWPDHGFHYLNMAFYTELEEISGYHVEFLSRHPAEGNSINGWNICCILRKLTAHFPSFESFKQLSIFDK